MTDALDIGVWHPRVGTAHAGGTEAFLRNVIPALARDHHVTLYTGAGELHPEVAAFPDGVTIRQLPWQSKEDPLTNTLTRTPIKPAEIETVSMVAAARRGGVLADIGRHDLLSTHYYLDALVLSRLVDTPHLFRFPGIKQPSARWRALLRYGAVDHWVANSPDTADRLGEWYGLNVDATVTPGVDCDAFRPTVGDGGDDHEEILYVGRLDPGKGLHELLVAHRQLDDVRLRLVGDGVLRDALEDTAGEGVVFEGQVSHDELPELYAGADVLAHPTDYEGFGMVVLEALASGTPVVASDLPAIRAQVDSETAWLVDSDDAMALADALADALSCDQYPVARARDHAREYDWSKQATALTTAYREAATEGRP